MKILTNLEMNQNQILDVILQSLAVAPSEAVAGQIYYNTKDKRAYVFNGDIWLAMDAKDASPTAVSIVNTINRGDSLINIEKIKNLSTKLSAANIVSTINSGTENISAQKINGLADALSDATIVNKINAGASKIDIAKIEGLNTKLDTNTIIENIIASNKTIPSRKITGLDNALASKITEAQAQAKADTALQSAKDYVKVEINKLVNGASTAYDTFKEIETLLKNNDSLNAALQEGIKGKTSKVTKIIGDNAATEFTINHNLNTQDVVVTVRENKAPFSIVLPDVEISNSNKIKVRFAKAVALEEYKVIIVG